MTRTATTAAETVRSESVNNNEESFLINMIEIGERHRKDFGDLDELANSIRKQGLLQPIGINENHELVFGERRLRACRDILKWETIPVRFVDVESILDGEVDENAMRKSFAVTELVSIIESLRRFAHGGDRRSDQVRSADDENLTIDQASKKVGLGNKDSFYRAKKVIENGVPELIAKMDCGEVPIAVAAEVATVSADQQRKLLANESGPLTLKSVKSKKQRVPKDRWEDEVAKVELEAGDSGSIESESPSSFTVTITSFSDVDSETIKEDLSKWQPKTKSVHGSETTSNISIKCSRFDLKSVLTKLGTLLAQCGKVRLVVEQ